MWDQVSSFVLFRKDDLATAVPNFSGSEKNGAAFDLQLVLRAARGSRRPLKVGQGQGRQEVEGLVSAGC